MKHIHHILFITCFIFVGCKNETIKNADSIDLSNSIRSDISVFDIFSKVEIIPLETTKESVITPFLINVEPVDSFFYVLDFNQEVIFIFDSAGNYQRKLDKNGQGPQDYYGLVDFNINRFTGNLELLSTYGYLQIYDKSGNEHKEKVDISEIIAVRNVENLTEDVYVFFAYSGREDKEKMFFYSRNEKKIIAKEYDFPGKVLITSFGHNITPFYFYSDSIFFFQAFNGDIFSIDIQNFKLVPRYSWDFGENTLEKSKIVPYNDTPNYYRQLSANGSRKYAMQFGLNAENSHYFMTSFFFNNKPMGLIHNKKDNTNIILRHFKEGFQCVPHFMDEEAMYSWFTYDYLSGIVNESVLDEENKIKLRNVKEDDNSVIVKYTFK